MKTNTFYTYVVCKIARSIMGYISLYIKEYLPDSIDKEDLDFLSDYPKSIEEIHSKNGKISYVVDKYCARTSDGELAKSLERLDLHFAHLTFLAVNYATMTTGTTKYPAANRRWLENRVVSARFHRIYDKSPMDIHYNYFIDEYVKEY